MTNFSIGIPTLNRADLLKPSLKHYVKDFPDVSIYVIDNGKQGIKEWVAACGYNNIIVFEEQTNLGVAASWNKLCKIIFETKKHALICNDDVYLGYNSNLVNTVIDKYIYGFIQSYHSWSVFLLSSIVYNVVGEFDEIFYPAYYEDSDYIYRMKLLGFLPENGHYADTLLNPEVVRISQTYEKAPEMVTEAMKTNKEKFIQKWGGLPLLETFVTPYNN